MESDVSDVSDEALTVLIPPEPPSPMTKVATTTSHVWPLLLLAIAILAVVLTLSLYGREPDRTLFDAFGVVVGAIAGVTWARQ